MLQRYLGLLIPSSITRPSQLMLARIIAFSAVISLLIALYSGIKWARLGNDPLVMGSLVLGLGMIGVVVVLRSGRLSLELVGNLALLFFFSYAMQLVYQLGGLHSAHIFWPVVLVVLAYVLVSPRSGAFWAAVSVIFVSWLILAGSQRRGAADLRAEPQGRNDQYLVRLPAAHDHRVDSPVVQRPSAQHGGGRGRARGRGSVAVGAAGRAQGAAARCPGR